MSARLATADPVELPVSQDIAGYLGRTVETSRAPHRNWHPSTVAGEPLHQPRTTDDADRDGKSAVNFVTSALVASAPARVMS